MEFKEKSKELLHKAPAPKAHRAQRPEVVISSRARKLLAISFALTGLICLLFTEHVYAILPYILGCTMAALGVTDTVRFRRTHPGRRYGADLRR